MLTLVDCGCQTKVHGDGSGVEVEFCSLHDAAAELLAACKRVDEICTSLLADAPKMTNAGSATAAVASMLRGEVRAAIAKAEA